MGKNKLILEKIFNSSLEEKEDNDIPNDFDGETDSDEELAKDFAQGKLKPGLYRMVPLEKTTDVINEKESLTNKLEEIRIFQDNWLERLDLSSEPAPVTPDLLHLYGDLNLKINRKGEISAEDNADDKIQNDFKRELLFYRQAQSTVIESQKRLRNDYGIKNTFRPDDYLAEMLKSDEHMRKVDERLKAKQISLEASEKAKRQRELKKYGKKVQQEVHLKRQQEKRELLEKIQKYKKGKLDSLDFLDDGQSSNNKNNKQNLKSKNIRPLTKLTKKQKYKEARYGYGGRKKRSKYNSAESAADVTGFSARKHGRPINKKKSNRPGKTRRQKMRNKK